MFDYGLLSASAHPVKKGQIEHVLSERKGYGPLILHRKCEVFIRRGGGFIGN